MSKISISNPKKVIEGDLSGVYFCEVYLPDTEKKFHPIYADEPNEATKNANNFVEIYLKERIRGIEDLLNGEGDIRKKLAKDLYWVKQQLAEHELTKQKNN